MTNWLRMFKRTGVTPNGVQLAMMGEQVDNTPRRFTATFYEVAGEHFVAMHGPDGDAIDTIHLTSDPFLAENRLKLADFAVKCARKWYSEHKNDGRG